MVAKRPLSHKAKAARAATAALAVLSLAAAVARADTAANAAAGADMEVEDAKPAAAEPPKENKLTTAEKIALVTPKDPWRPSAVQLPAGTLAEQFVSVSDFNKHWAASRAQKEDVPAGSDDDKDKDLWRYRGEWKVEEPKSVKGSGKGDLGLVVGTPAAHHAASRKLPQVVEFKGKDTVTVQYEVKLQNGLECGGAYLKLLSKDKAFEPAKFSDKSPYTIMFGPDKCGATNKVHFIFRHKNKRTNKIVEHHLKNPPSVPSTYSKETHLYTLLIHPEQNTYEIKIDNESKQKGSLLDDFEPPVVPPKEIDDPEDKKPSDWVDEAKIADPEAKKPEDWDEDAPLEVDDMDAKRPDDWLPEEPEYVPDPDAKKPADWDDEEDGEWTAPTVPNPKCAKVSGCGEWKRPKKANPAYKGKWTAPLIDNPAYKGVWKPRKIPNPEYVDEKHPGRMTPIGAVGFELWTMQDQILFDNILVSDSVTADQLSSWTKDTWVKKHDVELAVIKAEEPEATVEKDADESKGPRALAEQFSPQGFQDFAKRVTKDPKRALNEFPHLTGVAGALAGFSLLSVIFSLFSGSKAKVAAKPAKKTATKATKDAADKDAAENDEAEEVAPKAAKASGTSAAKGKGKGGVDKRTPKEATVEDEADGDE